MGDLSGPDANNIRRYVDATAIGLDWPDYLNLGLEDVSDAITDIKSDVYGQRQLDTTNSTGRFIVQHGVGKITGSGSSPTASEAVTFPAAFTGVPVVIVTGIGFRATGAFNAAGLSASQSVVGSAQGITATTFNANLYQATGGNLSAAQDWYYNWIAIGVAA